MKRIPERFWKRGNKKAAITKSFFHSPQAHTITRSLNSKFVEFSGKGNRKIWNPQPTNRSNNQKRTTLRNKKKVRHLSQFEFDCCVDCLLFCQLTKDLRIYMYYFLQFTHFLKIPQFPSDFLVMSFCSLFFFILLLTSYRIS